MAIIQLPANNWRPRPAQMAAWRYLENGGKHAELIWHRRMGKDEISLHHAAIKAHERVASYWHMLPQASQARKAIWDAINPHTGKRRIDEAFPLELRETTREQEMLIKFKIGSTWQVVGSDNYNSMVGSPPAGIVYSEWALANPAARAYLRPIIAENGGWQIFITTPRGKNHAYNTFRAAQKDPLAFAQRLTALESGAFTQEQLERERLAYIADFGEDYGSALFEQEFFCSFDAAIMGAYYASMMNAAQQQGRIRDVKADPRFPVHCAWDIGRSDDASIWWYQVLGGEFRILKAVSEAGKDADWGIEILREQAWETGNTGKIWLPHDAKAETFATGGKSVHEQFGKAFGWSRVEIVPSLSLQDGIQAVRKILPRCYFDELECEKGIEALSQYQREWDADAKCFREKPLHNWCSHPADAFRMLAVAWRHEPTPKEQQPTKFAQDLTINELIKRQAQRRREGE